MQNKKEIGWLLKEKYNNKPNKKFLEDVKRIEKGEPIDYIIGFVEFLGCRIDLSKKPLIPRKETEFWSEKAIENISSLGKKTGSLRCLDLFCGSGCVGVAVLAKAGILLCDISDKSQDCLQQARINCKLNNINKKRYRVIKSDIFSNIQGGYDFIFANPPYIPTLKKNKIQKSVLKYEPRQALFGGKDGLRCINKFLRDAKKHLNSGAKIFMEFDSPQKNSIEKILKNNKYSEWKFCKDQSGKWRWAEIDF
jgi:release factor glutamine methyltransferase